MRQKSLGYLTLIGLSLFIGCSRDYTVSPSGVINTPTLTPTSAASNTPTPSATATPTFTPTNSATSTPPSTSTNSPTPTASFTSTNTAIPTNTATLTVTNSATNTSTNTNSATATYTGTLTPQSPTNSPTATNSPTNSPTNTASLTATSTPTNSPNSTLSSTATSSPTISPTNSGSSTTTPVSGTPTDTYTPAPTPYCGTGSHFGWDYAGSVPAAFPNSIFWADSHLSEAATLTSIVIQMSDNPDGANVRVALYGAGPVIQSAPQVAVPGWNTFPMPNTYLAPGTYKLAFQIENTAVAPHTYDTVNTGTGPYYVSYGLGSWGPFPAGLPSVVYTTNVLYFSIYGVYCPVVPHTPTPTVTVTPTPTRTFTPGPAATATFTGTVSVNCATTTSVNLVQYLNSQQRADRPGGVLELGYSPNPVLPFAGGGANLNAMFFNLTAYNSGTALMQLDSMELYTDDYGLPNHEYAVDMGGETVAAAKAEGTGSYAWNAGGALPAAVTIVKTVTDSLAQSRQITFLFYQVNDLGTANPPLNIHLPRQAMYAWYAFETTGGQVPQNGNLLGGTGIIEGNESNTCPYDRGVPGDLYWGDFVFFNKDGSLASEGATRDNGGLGFQAKPILYLPPQGPTGVVKVLLNFGTAGLPGTGQKNGLYSDVLGDCSTSAPLNLVGNLNSTQEAALPGGIVNLESGGYPLLPAFDTSFFLDGSRASFIPYSGGYAIQQTSALNLPLDTNFPGAPHAAPLLLTGQSILGAVANASSSLYAWTKTGIPASCAAVKSVTDTFGNLRQVTILFYQVNDLGAASPAVNTKPPAQTAYAWYAFDTTIDPPAAANLIGGTGIMEGDLYDSCNPNMTGQYDRGIPGNYYWGDFIYFNPDGSLASEGGVFVDGGTGIGIQNKPYIYLPPINGFGILEIHLNFGTAGLPGTGLRDGITGDPYLSAVY